MKLFNNLFTSAAQLKDYEVAVLFSSKDGIPEQNTKN